MEILIFIGVGVVVGFFLGRGSAERGRARFDGGRAWATRKNYRL